MRRRPIALTDQRLLVCIHHSAANDKYSDPETLKHEAELRRVGYNFVIDDDEALTRAEAGNDRKVEAVQMLDDNLVSNGAWGANSSGPWYAWNICVDGNFEHQEPTADELHALIQVIAVKVRRWGWKKKDVWRVTYHQEVGHKYSPVRYGTACPGKNLINKIEHIRAKVAGYLPE